MIRVALIVASARERDRWTDQLEAAGARIVATVAGVETLTDEILESADVILVETSSDSVSELLEGFETEALARDLPLVLLTASSSGAWMTRALRAGVRGILQAGLSPEQLASALEAVIQGLVVLHPERPQLRADPSLDEIGTASLIEPLTPREREVLQMLAQGRGNKEIAARLKISEHTVKFHVASILGKLGASTRTEAVSIALRRGLVLI